MNFFEITDKIGQLIDDHRNCAAEKRAIYFNKASQTISLFCSVSNVSSIALGKKITRLSREDLQGLT